MSSCLSLDFRSDVLVIFVHNLTFLLFVRESYDVRFLFLLFPSLLVTLGGPLVTLPTENLLSHAELRDLPAQTSGLNRHEEELVAEESDPPASKFYQSPELRLHLLVGVQEDVRELQQTVGGLRVGQGATLTQSATSADNPPNTRKIVQNTKK